jgi:glycerol-3-phosphate dehydrogenase
VLRLTKGAHVVVPRTRIGNEHAITLISQLDGRVIFILPWGDFSYIGTTDTDADSSPDAVTVSEKDVTYLLRSANAAFPDAHLAPSDVVSAWAGLRPLLRPGDHTNPSRISREHRIMESAHGLVTIAGGKLTTYRVMARQVVDRVARRLHELDGRPLAAAPSTDELALPGGEAAALEVLVAGARARGATEATARHLVGNYGTESAAILNLIDRDRSLEAPLTPGRSEIWAEVTYAVEREMALRVQDVLIRRLHLFHELRDQGAKLAPAVAQRMRKLLGWDETREAEELQDYFAVIERARIRA